MKLPSKKITIPAVFIILVLLGYFVGMSRLASTAAPQKFAEARMQGAVISDDIVNLSNDISKDLAQVNEEDKAGNYTEALNTTTLLIQKTSDIKKRATDLSKELESMANSLLEIKSKDAQAAAMESITNRMALISRLLSYSEYLGQLSNTLRDHFTETPSNQNVGAIIDQINSEISAINSFNNQAKDAMAKFDKLAK